MINQTHDHPSASVIHERVRRSIPNISLATVYRNLEAMVAGGLVCAINGSHERRYDANTMPHHHLLCQGSHDLRYVPEYGSGGSLK